MKKLFSVLLLICLSQLAGCSNYQSSLLPNEPELPISESEFFAGGVIKAGPYSVREAEEIGLDHVKGSKAPQKPFGFKNDEWIEFKKDINDTDEIYFFRSPSDRRTIAGGFSYTGIAVVRDDSVVKVFERSVQ